MLTPVIFIALISLLPAGSGTKHTCVPNSQFVLNGQMCFCDSDGWWNTTNCRAISRRTCTPGQIIWQGCNQCICQENEKLICNNAACYADTSSEDTFQKSDLILSNPEISGQNPQDTWCTPYKSYYVNCSICVCSASGKTADAHCAKDNSCQKLPPSTSDFLTYVNKNICIPKVMYLFSCLHCLCSDGGYFILDQCVETCRRPQQADSVTRRCISKTFYLKDCNVCLCPNNGVADDKLCTKLVCEEGSKLKPLESLKVTSKKCKPNFFLRPKCFYCTCDANGLLNENACLKSDCLKTKYFKYDISMITCSPGEMVPICQECFCLKGGITNQSYCSNVCSYQSKLSVLEKVLKDNRDNNELPDRDKIQRISENENCQPNSMYLDHSRYCLCPENGSTNFKLCTSIVEESYPINPNLSLALSILPFNNSISASCEPNSFVEIDCNTCYCGKNGRIDPKWCTNDDCDAKRIIQNGQTSLRGPTINHIHFNDTCVPGSVTKWKCNFCICPQSGKTKDRACTTNTCSEIQEAYEEKFVCEPLAYYLVDCNVCLCPRDGVKNVELCTKKICEKTILRSDSCTPGQFFSNECNVCVCPPNGNKADRVCTKHKCSDLETPWKKIFRLSESLLAGNSIQEGLATKQDLDFCFSGEEFEIGCKICVCPDVGLKSHASCSEIMCEQKATQDNNGLEDTNTDVSKAKSSEKSMARRKRHHRHYKQEPEPPSQPVFEKDSDCFTFNLTNSSERKECTPGSMYIIRCRQCICPYVGNINYFCRALPQGKYCEQAFPNFNYVPMGRRIAEDKDVANSSDTRSPHSIRHNHTKYECTKPGKVLDECYICECEQDGVLVEEHCFNSDAENCVNAKPTFLDTVNKVVILP
ncbi:hypothetical protein evm_004512 [Chilo suppressalis]|nr:hypothetical protein evm_004512 [Chilo suppressalis]